MSTTKSGFLLSIALVVGLIPALTLPSLAARAHDQRLFVSWFMCFIAAGWIGVIVAADVRPLPVGGPARLWSERGVPPRPHPDRASRRHGERAPPASRPSTQTVGYLIAAVGPLAIGAVHDSPARGRRRCSSCSRCSSPVAPRAGRGAQPHGAAAVGSASLGIRRRPMLGRAASGAGFPLARHPCGPPPPRLATPVRPPPGPPTPRRIRHSAPFLAPSGDCLVRSRHKSASWRDAASAHGGNFHGRRRRAIGFRAGSSGGVRGRPPGKDARRKGGLRPSARSASEPAHRAGLDPMFGM